MGIINVTPDSFYTESRKKHIEEIIFTAGQMLDAGATFLDVGGMSTRPGADEISPAEELNRVVPSIEAIAKKYPNAIISIDTYRSQVAEAALNAGATIINDISGGDFDKTILTVAAKKNAPYICMHIQGTPKTMQQNPSYENVVKEVFQHLQQKVVRCREAGIKDVIIDLGFGFGKTIEHNYELLSNMRFFEQLDCPILAGLSRKGMIYKPLKNRQDDALAGTISANTIALQNGADILRVHDVKPAVDCVKIWEVLHPRV